MIHRSCLLSRVLVVLVSLSLATACQHNVRPQHPLQWKLSPGCSSAPEESVAPRDSVANRAAQLFARFGMSTARTSGSFGTTYVTGGPSKLAEATSRGLPATFILESRISGDSTHTIYRIEVQSAESTGGRFTSTDSLAVRDIVIGLCVKLTSEMERPDKFD